MTKTVMAMRKTGIESCSVLFGCVVICAACGSVPPPRSLLDARAAFHKAQSSQAASLVPAELYEAKVALSTAEQSFLDEGDTEKTFALAYIAQREAEKVIVSANINAAQAQRDQAQKDITELQAQSLALAHGELSRTRRELDLKGKQLAMTSEQLEAERKAREEAERRMREALQRVAEAAALAVKQEDRGTVIVLPGEVLFESGQAELRPLAQQKIALIAEQIRTQPDSQITVEGHTDSRGSESDNLALSQSRADSVRSYLVSQGIPGNNIRAVGVGEGRPVASNETPEGRANNRRVEIVVKQGEPR